jgi:hypothetical protein
MSGGWFGRRDIQQTIGGWLAGCKTLIFGWFIREFPVGKIRWNCNAFLD